MKLRDSQYREAMDFAPDALLLADSAGTILFANRQVETLLGYEPAELVGQKIEVLVPDELRALHPAHRADFGTEPRMRAMGSGLELHARHRSGRSIPVEISLGPLATEEGIVICAAIRDVTERKLAEKLLTEARDAADKALAVNSRFLTAASHDLRQPLQTIALLGHNLKKIVTDGPAAALLENHALAVTSATRLLNKLLDISRLEAGGTSVELADYDLRELLAPLLAEFRPTIEAKKLELRVALPAVSVHTDATYFDQLLRNLLANAVKFTAAGRIEVRGRLGTQGGDETLMLEISDTGMGIEPEKLPHIFEDFFQVTRSGPKREGHGLGLGIVHRLAPLLGIQIDVMSELGRGTTFTIQVPLANPLQAAAPHAAVDAQAAEPRSTGLATRILLVDDDDAVRNATTLLLRLEGFTVLPANGLREALEQCTRHGRPDLVVSDYHLESEVTGMQVLERIRRAHGADVPAIFVTGDTSQIDLPRHGIALTQLLRKPVEPEFLIRAIRVALN
jgi:protein-histidine pros-kinase